MADLAQQIRDRLDGFENGPSGPLPAVFMAVRRTDPVPPAEAEAWRACWDELLADLMLEPVRFLPPLPRHYPGFEQMRDAILAVLEFAAPGGPVPGERDSRDHCEKAIDAEVDAVLARIRAILAEGLGIEAPDA